MDLVSTAIEYARKGYQVLPLYAPVKTGGLVACRCGNPNCKSTGKHPIINNGVKGATTDENTIRQWFERWPDANIGIRTGKESGMIAIDIDPRHGGNESLALLEDELEALPETLIAQTGGDGQHIFFKHPGGNIKNSAGKLGDGIDIRGDGGYVVVEPSIHASGGQYIFSQALDDFSILDMPSSWLARIRGSNKSKHKKNKNGHVKEIHEGSRNDSLMKYAGSLRNKGLSAEEIAPLLKVRNETRCKPPLEELEVRSIADSVSRYPTGEEVAKESKKNQATLLTELIEEGDLFHGDDDSEGFASIVNDGHRETWPIRSSGFRNWLSQRYYHKYGKAPSASALLDAINVASGIAIHQGNEYSVAVRIAKHEGTIYIDLANIDWKIIAVDADGWRVIDSNDVPVRFIRKRGMLALPTPVQGGSINDLRPLVNLPDDNAWFLFVAWLVMGFSAFGPFPILAVNGEQGSAKSTLCRFARALIDPNKAGLRRPPKDERDLMIAAQNSWVVGFDNLSGINPKLSDSLCCLSTGAAFATRELYTDGDEKLFSAQRPVIINGIDELVTRSDLADRTVSITLPVIDPRQRRDEAGIIKEFEALRPRLLGALLDAVSAALRNRDSVKLESSPRMADFVKWVVAAEECLGWKPGEFQSAYETSRMVACRVALESTIVGSEILRFLEESNGCWEGTPTSLYAVLTNRAKQTHGSLSKYWPQTPSSLSKLVKRLASDLRMLGFRVDRGHKGTGDDRQRWIEFEGNWN